MSHFLRSGSQKTYTKPPHSMDVIAARITYNLCANLSAHFRRMCRCRFWSVLYLIGALFSLASATESGPGVIIDVCMVEVYEAQCKEGQVIMMKSALYGRMRTGRCVQSNFDLGCVSNALSHFDQRCSGRQSCSVAIPDPELHVLNTCPQGSAPYLEAMYECVPVVSGFHHDLACDANGVVVLADPPEGIIASSDVFSIRSGVRVCPWTLEAAPGQRINVTLYDFGGTPNLMTSCQRYTLLSEGPGDDPFTVCASSERITPVYISRSNRLELTFFDEPIPGQERSLPNFLVKYSFVGCPDPHLQGNIILDRSAERAELYCEASGQKTWLRCLANHWDVEVEECAEGSDGSYWKSFAKNWTVAKGVVITVGILIGFCVVIGAGVLIYTCIGKCRRSDYEEPEHIYYKSDALSKDGQYVHRWNTDGPLLAELNYNTRGRPALGTDPSQAWIPQERWIPARYPHDYESVSATDNHTTLSSLPSTSNTIREHQGSDLTYEKPV